MAGLLQRVAGGALAGVGQGIVANAQNLRAERLEALRQANADRRHQRGLAQQAAQHKETLALRRSEGEASRALTASEGAAGRASAEKIAGVRAAASGAKTKAAHEKWLNTPVVVGERLLTDGSTEKVHKTNRQLLEDIRGGNADDARAVLRDEIVAAAGDQRSVFNWFSDKDNATDADIEKAFKLREKNPDLTAAAALDEAMGGRFLAGGAATAPAGAMASPRTPSGGGDNVSRLPGNGTMESPYQATSQVDMDLFKRTAPKGAYIRMPDGRVVRKP